ncbi:MAG: CsbD family protein [Solirubrobacterales bacterium]|nr:CsbD family protein [Solirubrobacterales bacterium]MCO5326963.1 CsbD family protein [Solirubrobacterales bacterium]
MDDNKTEGKVDEGKGRVKEAAGSLTDDDSLKNEGKVDKAAGKTKQKLGDAGERVGDVVSGAADKVKKAL